MGTYYYRGYSGLTLLFCTILIFAIIVTFLKVIRHKPFMDLIMDKRLFDYSTAIAILLLLAIFAMFIVINNSR